MQSSSRCQHSYGDDFERRNKVPCRGAAVQEHSGNGLQYPKVSLFAVLLIAGLLGCAYCGHSQPSDFLDAGEVEFLMRLPHSEFAELSKLYALSIASGKQQTQCSVTGGQAKPTETRGQYALSVLKGALIELRVGSKGAEDMLGPSFEAIGSHPVRNDMSSNGSSRGLLEPENDKIGRTAICVTGQARVLGLNYPHGFDRSDICGHTQDDGTLIKCSKYLSTDTYIGNINHDMGETASSIQNHLYTPLARSGGFDVFVYVHAQGNHSEQPQTMPFDMNKFHAEGPDKDTCEDRHEFMHCGQSDIDQAVLSQQINPAYMHLRPAGEAQYTRGIKNKFFLSVGEPECSIFFSEQVQHHHWNQFWIRHPPSDHRLLYQLYDQHMCGNMIQRYARETGVKYKYAIRLRADMAFVAPFPDVHTLNLGTEARPIVRHVAQEQIIQ